MTRTNAFLSLKCISDSILLIQWKTLYLQRREMFICKWRNAYICICAAINSINSKLKKFAMPFRKDLYTFKISQNRTNRLKQKMDEKSPFLLKKQNRSYTYIIFFNHWIYRYSAKNHRRQKIKKAFWT